MTENRQAPKCCGYGSSRHARARVVESSAQTDGRGAAEGSHAAETHTISERKLPECSRCPGPEAADGPTSYILWALTLQKLILVAELRADVCEEVEAGGPVSGDEVGCTCGLLKGITLQGQGGFDWPPECFLRIRLLVVRSSRDPVWTSSEHVVYFEWLALSVRVASWENMLVRVLHADATVYLVHARLNAEKECIRHTFSLSSRLHHGSTADVELSASAPTDLREHAHAAELLMTQRLLCVEYTAGRQSRCCVAATADVELSASAPADLREHAHAAELLMTQRLLCVEYTAGRQSSCPQVSSRQSSRPCPVYPPALGNVGVDLQHLVMWSILLWFYQGLVSIAMLSRMARLKAASRDRAAENLAGPSRQKASENVSQRLSCRGRKEEEKAHRVMEASITISVGGGDIDVGLLACVQTFLESETLAGICSVERGGTLLHLHLQMVVRMWSTSLVAINKMVKNYLGWANAPPPGGIVICRALTQRRLHTLEGIIGYCLKDNGQAHFQVVQHNMTTEQINQGIELYMLHGYDEAKNKVMTNLFKMLLSLEMASFPWEARIMSCVCWDLNMGVTALHFVGHTKDVLSVAFSIDNRHLVFASLDCSIKLWNIVRECN
ncbi:hypothetical protein L7F22_054236 [Adiantum nelumboides]|nr:hypothetical protein [Adiantum nelumboides]